MQIAQGYIAGKWRGEGMNLVSLLPEPVCWAPFIVFHKPEFPK
jgi:hypothetical protein